MKIDEEKEFVLTNYCKSKGKIREIDSDHLTMFLKLKMKFKGMSNERKTFFNFNNQDGLQNFKMVTNTNKKFVEHFEDNTKSLNEQAKAFGKSLMETVKMSFSKVRKNTNNLKQSEVGKLIEQKNNLKQNLKLSADVNEQKKLMDELEETVSKIEALIAEENVTKFKDVF